MAKQDRGALTRQKVIMATAAAINEYSFEKSPLSAIAERADISKGAISHHFKSKEELALEVIKVQSAYSGQKAMATVGEGRPAIETMLLVSADLMHDIVVDPLVRAGIRLTVEIRLLEKPPLGAWEGWTAFNDMMLTKAREEGTLDPDVNIPWTASLIVSGLAGIIVLSYLSEDVPGLPERVFRMWDDFVRSKINDREASDLRLYARQVFLDRPQQKILTLEEAIERHPGLTDPKV